MWLDPFFLKISDFEWEIKIGFSSVGKKTALIMNILSIEYFSAEKQSKQGFKKEMWQTYMTEIQ